MWYLFAGLTGCAEPVAESPPTMDDLCRSLLLAFDTVEAEEQGAQLAAWMDSFVDDAEPAYRLDALAASHVEGLEFSDAVDFDVVVGAAVIRLTRGSLDQHAAVVPEADQRFADTTYERWDRTITSGSANDYLDGGELVTDNQIVKSAPLGISLPYPMKKEYRWLDQRRMQIIRSVIYEEGWGDDSNGVIGGFTMEAWVPSGDDHVIWLNATWSQIETILGAAATDDFLIAQIIDGTTSYMEGTERYVAGEE